MWTLEGFSPKPSPDERFVDLGGVEWMLNVVFLQRLDGFGRVLHFCD